MVSIAHQALQESIRTRSAKPLTIITSFHSHEESVFQRELSEICANSNGNISHYSAFTNVTPNMKLGRDYHHEGRINQTFLQTYIPLEGDLEEFDYYLCGPVGFMQSLYDMLCELDVPDNRIFAEEFGSASLKRLETSTVKTASEAVIEFTQSGVEQLWTPDNGSLLELAESHGLQPEFSCRRGKCGACKVKLISGKVVYTSKVDAYLGEEEILLCCAAPAPGIRKVKIEI